MCFFFFKQKTAYEMRISDWSSDVCSSDLQIARQCLPAPRIEHPAADRVPLARCRDRAVRAERLAQDQQLLIHRPATAATDDLDPTAHTITHMTGHKSTRSRRSNILVHHQIGRAHV